MRGISVHTLSEVDPSERTAICAVCGPTKLKNKGYKRGKQQWACYTAWNDANRGRSSGKAQRHKRWKYLNFRGDECERPECTATIEHPAQLDVHHIDGDHKNNDPANLMTLCANCHRLWHKSR